MHWLQVTGGSELRWDSIKMGFAEDFDDSYIHERDGGFGPLSFS